MSPVPRGLFERLLPRNLALRRIKKWLLEDTEAIVSRNVSNLHWATLQNINDTFYRFSLELDRELKEIASTARGAIQEAQTQRVQKADSVAGELERLGDLECKLHEIKGELAR